MEDIQLAEKDCMAVDTWPDEQELVSDFLSITVLIFYLTRKLDRVKWEDAKTEMLLAHKQARARGWIPEAPPRKLLANKQLKSNPDAVGASLIHGGQGQPLLTGCQPNVHLSMVSMLPSPTVAQSRRSRQALARLRLQRRKIGRNCSAGTVARRE